MPRLRAGRAGELALLLLFASGLTAVPDAGAATVVVDCNAGGAVGPMLSGLKAGDVLFVRGTCQENIVIAAQVHDIIEDASNTGLEISQNSFARVVNNTARIIGNTIRANQRAGLTVQQVSTQTWPAIRSTVTASTAFG